MQDVIYGCDAQWRGLLETALSTMNTEYLQEVLRNENYLPGAKRMFAAFSLPLAQTQFILLGESPYPRKESANGYAFWDNAVGSLWSEQGLSKEVNRATSLRNLLKTLLLARGDLQEDLSQASIAKLNKGHLVQTAEQLFTGMMHKGILLLNASLVYSDDKVPYHARNWQPFMQSLLQQLAEVKPDVQLIVLGKIAQSIPKTQLKVGLLAEHPYNISFIKNARVLEFFKPLDLLAHETP